MLSTIDAETASRLREHELSNSHGDRVRLLNFGARISSIMLSLHNGAREVVLGYPNTNDYFNDPWYMGCTIGRCCNRIRQSQFVIDGETFHLSPNHGPHHLHGGSAGFDKQFWSLDGRADGKKARFDLYSPDGDQGYPGNLSVAVEYAWNDRRELLVTYVARTDRATHVNLTNHAYFNLDGGNGDVLDHHIRINSNALTDFDENMLPTGEVLDIRGSDLDLRSERKVGSFLASAHPLVARADGADLNYVLNRGAAAELHNGKGDLRLMVDTSCPGLQFYCGQHLGAPFKRHGGICLEPQYFPDSANRSTFPATLLMPGQRYAEVTRYSFIENP